MRPILAIPIAAAFLAVFFMTAPAAAQTLCGERSAVVARLEKTYSEAPVSMGLASNGAVIEILASPSGSFTIIVTRPNGLSCVMAAGEGWETLPRRLAGSNIDYLPSVPLREAGEPWATPSTWGPGTVVAFRGFCRDMRDIFRLARLYDSDPTNRAPFAYFEAGDNSCRSSALPRVGVLRERVSARAVVNGKRNLAHIWRVETAGGELVFVIVAEDPRGRREG